MASNYDYALDIGSLFGENESSDSNDEELAVTSEPETCNKTSYSLTKRQKYP